VSYKNINITNDEFYSKLLEIAKENNIKIEPESKPNNLTIYHIIIPGDKEATVNVYDTKRGLTISPNVGKNQKFSEKIVKSVLQNVEKVTTETQNIEGIHKELFDEFCDYFSDFLKETNKKNHETMLKLEDKNGSNLTVHWYYKNKKMMLQGRKTPFWKQIEYWITDKTKTSADEIIKILVESEKDFGKYTVAYKDSFVTSEIFKLMPNAVNDNKILNHNEKKWLKTCYFLTKSDITLDDYLCTVFGAINTIEGILRRLLLHHFSRNAFNTTNNSFYCFERDGKLQERFSNQMNTNAVNIVEELYDFYKQTRNNYFHNPGLSQHMLTDKQEAVELFDKIINLINKVADNKREVLKKQK